MLKICQDFPRFSRKAYSRLLRDMENPVRLPTEMDTDTGLLFYVKYNYIEDFKKTKSVTCTSACKDLILPLLKEAQRSMR